MFSLSDYKGVGLVDLEVDDGGVQTGHHVVELYPGSGADSLQLYNRHQNITSYLMKAAGFLAPSWLRSSSSVLKWKTLRREEGSAVTLILIVMANSASQVRKSTELFLQ